MLTINAYNINEAWAMFMRMMTNSTWVQDNTRKVCPRGICTLEITGPVATTYTKPEECVLMDPVRDCNPFFHLYEALWMLCGHNDVDRVKFYSPQIATYSDDNQIFHGAYGYRWRTYFRFDQLKYIISLLRKDPATRRAVLAMWSAHDLGAADEGKDIPCNLNACFLLREGRLHMTVYNRSNDAIWGCYGANAVHFPILLQYIAGSLGVAIGTYTQVSNSLHVYLEGKAGEVWRRCAVTPPPLFDTQVYASEGIGAHRVPLIHDADVFLKEAQELTEHPNGEPGVHEYTEPWLRDIALPMLLAHCRYREGDLSLAEDLLKRAMPNYAAPDPWIAAGQAWIGRRMQQRAVKEQTA